MPRLFIICGYVVSIWSNENNEPIHVHVSKGRASSNSTKIWLLSTGDVLLANNKSRIPAKSLSIIMRAIKTNYSEIVQFWAAYHGYVSFYR